MKDNPELSFISSFIINPSSSFFNKKYWCWSLCFSSIRILFLRHFQTTPTHLLTKTKIFYTAIYKFESLTLSNLKITLKASTNYF